MRRKHKFIQILKRLLILAFIWFGGLFIFELFFYKNDLPWYRFHLWQTFIIGTGMVGMLFFSYWRLKSGYQCGICYWVSPIGATQCDNCERSLKAVPSPSGTIQERRKNRSSVLISRQYPSIGNRLSPSFYLISFAVLVLVAASTTLGFWFGYSKPANPQVEALLPETAPGGLGAKPLH